MFEFSRFLPYSYFHTRRHSIEASFLDRLVWANSLVDPNQTPPIKVWLFVIPSASFECIFVLFLFLYQEKTFHLEVSLPNPRRVCDATINCDWQLQQILARYTGIIKQVKFLSITTVNYFSLIPTLWFCDLFQNMWTVNERQHDKTHKITYVPSGHSDQPGHLPSLIRVFAVRIRRNSGSLATHWVDSKDWSHWADAQADLRLRWAHMSFC